MHKVPFLIIILITISLIPFSFSEGIPEWVKNNASWWSERQISQTEFTNALEFLMKELSTFHQQTLEFPDLTKIFLTGLEILLAGGLMEKYLILDLSMQ
jgi:hypothetical protein